MTKAYLLGVLHDSTERKTTYRVASKSHEFCMCLVKGITVLGYRAWIYKEGKTRNLWIVEFSKAFLKGIKIQSTQDKIDYIRGYFDTEGGISKSPKVRYYLYFCQKNLADLETVKQYLKDLGISCGVIHNPSKRVDPNYWRFFIRAKSYLEFAKVIGSYHPEKASYLRMKI
ncbi:MAG: Uncharacterized protein G01um10145_388 [Microgenomates group bacterium Gr01-1014_5]|nr:MAG: Uncharacterized protein G01um10145_388 [Microgenomates group bacterium Gr01-1014_5]